MDTITCDICGVSINTPIRYNYSYDESLESNFKKIRLEVEYVLDVNSKLPTLGSLFIPNQDRRFYMNLCDECLNDVLNAIRDLEVKKEGERYE